MDIPNQQLHKISSTAIIYKDGKYLLLQRSLDKKAFPGKWTVPGGKLEVKDYIGLPKTTNDHWYFAIDKALRREIMEEAGLEVGKLKYLLDMVFMQPDGVPGVILSFYCDYKSGNVKLDEDNINYAWATLDEARNYDMVEGLLGELEMVEKIIKGADPDKMEYNHQV